MGFADLVGACPEQGESLPGAAHRLTMATLLEVDAAKVAEDRGLPGLVAGLSEQRDSLTKSRRGLRIVALPHVHRCEVDERLSFGGVVADHGGGLPGAGMDGDRLGIVAADVKVTVDDRGHVDSMAWPAIRRGV